MRIARDSGVEEMTGFSEQIQFNLVSTDLWRFLLDVNRFECEADGTAVEGRGDPEHANGLIWHSTIGKVENVDHK